MRTALIFLTAAALTTLPAFANSLYTYEFDYTSGNLPSFSIQIPTDTLVAPTTGSNPFPVFPSVNLTDFTDAPFAGGSTPANWTFTQGGLYTGGQNQCYIFGTSNATIGVGGCGDSLATDGSPSAVVIFSIQTVSVDVAAAALMPGNYQVFSTFFDVTDGSNANSGQDFNAATLTITSGAPEPATFALLGGAALAALANRRRLRVK